MFPVAHLAPKPCSRGLLKLEEKIKAGRKGPEMVS